MDSHSNHVGLDAHQTDRFRFIENSSSTSFWAATSSTLGDILFSRRPQKVPHVPVMDTVLSTRFIKKNAVVDE